MPLVKHRRLPVAPWIVLAGLVLLAASSRPALANDELDDAPAPLAERTPRTQQDRNHIEALGLFGAGRIEEQKDHLAEALRLYQRALRYEPNSLPIVRQIVPLAFTLERPNEAVRYALLAAELDPSDPQLLRQLGLHLADAGRFQQALKLYRQAREHLKDKPRSAASIMLSMELGRLCFVTGHAQDAVEAFAEIMPVFDKPDDFGLTDSQKKMFTGDEGARSLALAASVFLAANQADRAQSAYEKLDKLRPDKAVLAYHLARVSEQKGDAAGALAHLQTYFDEKGTAAGAGPYELLAQLLKRLDKQGELLARLETIAANQPANNDVRLTLAEAAQAAGQNDKAEPLFKQLQKAAPSEDVYTGLIKLYRQTERWADLVKVLGELAGDQDLLDLLDEQAKELAKDDKAAQQLIIAARAALAADPDRLKYGDRMALALIGLEAKQFAVAGEFFDLAIKAKREDAAGLFEAWGVGLLLAEQYAEAAKVFQRAIDEHVLPAGNTAFHHYLAGALEMAGQTDAAVAVAQAAIAMPDAPPRLYARLAWVLYHAKRRAEAEKAYRDFLARFDSQYESEDLRALLRDARLVLSTICANRHEMREAEELLEQVLDEYPENIGAMNDLGYLWAEQNKNLDRAIPLIQQAVEGDPENEAYRDSLGWAYFQTGRYADAVAELNKAVALGGETPDGVIIDHLGDAYEKAGQADAARETWQRALTAFEREQDTDKASLVRQKLHPQEK